MDKFIQVLSMSSDFLTIIASTIAIYLFVTKKDEVYTVFGYLKNYVHKLSLSELKEKLERINDCSFNDPDDHEIILNLFNEVVGQIKGNESLIIHFSKTIKDVEEMLSNKKFYKEPRKRALVSEFKEKIRNLDFHNLGP